MNTSLKAQRNPTSNVGYSKYKKIPDYYPGFFMFKDSYYLVIISQAC